ncbi:Alpha-humulene/(-)-(E)-beta-caryophyllene synthase [Forsythia ovata]|uniref:Alpha-humulene/(-)-(E)-beta-caryophyllene synthase n=1 Tax=Forsythia ovata TaxID=205694 RepID=A0ABD1S8P0_9LAMI
MIDDIVCEKYYLSLTPSKLSSKLSVPTDEKDFTEIRSIQGLKNVPFGSPWQDFFFHCVDFNLPSLNIVDILPNEEQERQILREEVKKLLAATPDDSLLKLDLIDAIQHLGVGYHFVTEIEKSLKYVNDTYESCVKQDNDLHTIALRFRLLRQQGYFVSCDVFNKFKNRKGNFDESLISNVQGLLSLYEAAQFRVHGEEILEEALEFSTTQLNSLVVHKKRLASAYFEEAKWVYSCYIPSLEEYMKVGMPSGTYILLSTVALAGINGELVSKEAFEWVSSDPLILQASEIIGRLMNDLVGFGFEQKISAVGCYMNQNKGASKEEAFAEIQKLVTNAWIDINQEWLRPSPTAVPMVFLMQVIVNLSRTTHLMYKDIDAYTNSEVNLKDIITFILIQPVTIP